MPADTSSAGTTARRPVRPVAPSEPSTPEPPASSRSGRVFGIAAGCVLVIAAIGAAFLFSHHGGGHAPTGTGPSAGHSQSALGPGITAPGTPAVVVIRAGHKLRFHWTYANHAAGDTFRWRRVSSGTGPAAGTTTRTTLLLAPRGRSVCITVRVVRVNGQASGQSTPACGP
jgi:hypothetical protein